VLLSQFIIITFFKTNNIAYALKTERCMCMYMYCDYQGWMRHVSHGTTAGRRWPTALMTDSTRERSAAGACRGTANTRD